MEPTTPAETTSDARPHPVRRYARRVATPLAIVFAWVRVVDGWGASETDLFNWATATAGVVLALVTGAWLLSLRIPRLRRALLPLEGGLVVGALVLALSTSGREVDELTDHVAVAFAFGLVATILLGIVAPLVDGRRRAGAWVLGTVAFVAVAGIALPAALDWLDGDYGDAFADPYITPDLLVRMSDRGLLLGETSVYVPASTLREGYARLGDPGVGVVDVLSGAPMAAATPLDPASSVDPFAGIGPGPGPDPTAPRSDWARLHARADGSLWLAIARSMAEGVDDPVVAVVRRGSCRTAFGSPELLRLQVEPGTSGDVERRLPVAVDHLAIGDQYSVVAGIDAPLAPTRCADLLRDAGIVLAQLGAHDFVPSCMADLDVEPGLEYLVQASSFEDADCARRFASYRDVASSLVVPRDRVAAYRTCVRDREQDLERAEERLPDGSLLVRYDPATGYGDCITHGSNAGAYSMSMSGSMAMPVDAATGLPAL